MLASAVFLDTSLTQLLKLVLLATFLDATDAILLVAVNVKWAMFWVLPSHAKKNALLLAPAAQLLILPSVWAVWLVTLMILLALKIVDLIFLAIVPKTVRFVRSDSQSSLKLWMVQAFTIVHHVDLLVLVVIPINQTNVSVVFVDSMLLTVPARLVDLNVLTVMDLILVSPVLSAIFLFNLQRFLLLLHLLLLQLETV